MKNEQINQCDGCQRGLPVDKDGLHKLGTTTQGGYMYCTKDRYEERCKNCGEGRSTHPSVCVSSEKDEPDHTLPEEKKCEQCNLPLNCRLYSCQCLKSSEDVRALEISNEALLISQRDIEARAKSNLRATEIISRLILNCSNPSVIKWLEKAQKEILADEALLDNRKK